MGVAEKHVSQIHKSAVEKAIDAKLDALRAYSEGEAPSFSVPPKFSMNWFASLEEGELKAISKSGAQFKKRKPDIIEVLEAAEKKLHQKTVTVTSEAFEALQSKCDAQAKQIEELKAQIVGLGEENMRLLKEEIEEARGASVEQAQWRDKRIEMNKRNGGK